MKPLFIPLKGKYFDAFACGTKTTEYRVYGPRWNERTCPVGRDVVLSRGYGKYHRLTGRITGFWVDQEPQNRAGWVECYGKETAAAACIQIALTSAVLP